MTTNTANTHMIDAATLAVTATCGNLTASLPGPDDYTGDIPGAISAALVAAGRLDALHKYAAELATWTDENTTTTEAETLARIGGTYHTSSNLEPATIVDIALRDLYELVEHHPREQRPVSAPLPLGHPIIANAGRSLACQAWTTLGRARRDGYTLDADDAATIAAITLAATIAAMYDAAQTHVVWSLITDTARAVTANMSPDTVGDLAEAAEQVIDAATLAATPTAHATPAAHKAVEQINAMAAQAHENARRAVRPGYADAIHTAHLHRAVTAHRLPTETA